jgi:23S rRNA pseudouridine2605 synthase
MSEERLQKIIAAAGVASRRKAEELITGGRVTVNGNVVSELGSKANPESDDIRVDGKTLKAEQLVYVLLHKPKGYVTTVTDPEGRPTVMDLVKAIPARVFPVGRLDYLSEGLLLLTNDGEVAAKLTHASTHVPKKYLVKVSGVPTEEQIDELRHGVQLPPEQGNIHADPREGGRFGGEKRRSTAVKTAPCKIELTREGDNPWYEVTLTEGRNRQIRRMFDFIGHHVEKIKRVEYGPLKLDVENGEFRMLNPAEVARLKQASQGKHEPARARDERPRFGKSRGERPAFGRKEARKPFQKGSYVDRSQFEDSRQERTRTARFDAEGKREPEAPREQFERPKFQKREEGGRPAFRGRRDDARGERPKFDRGARPRGERPFREKREGGARGERPFRGKPAGGGGFREKRPFGSKPAGGERGERPFRGKPAGERSFGGKKFEGGHARGGSRPPSAGRPKFGARPERGERGERPRTGAKRFERSGAVTEGRSERPFRGKPAGGAGFRGKRDDRPAFRGGRKEGGFDGRRREGGSRPPRGDRFEKKPGGFRKEFRPRRPEDVPEREEPRSQEFVDNVAKRFAGKLESGRSGDRKPRRGPGGGPKKPFRKPKDRR